MVEPVEQDSRGILHPGAGLSAFRLDRFTPCAPVARFVDRYWLVAWNLPEGRRHEQQVLTHPVVNVVFEQRTAIVSGVQTGRFTRVLEGTGSALGIMFRPGGFHPFLGQAMSAITDTVRPLTDVAALAGIEAAVSVACAQDGGDERIVADLDELLEPLIPADPQPSETTTAWAEAAAADRTLTRVQDLADTVGVTVRRLQRAFSDHVGVSPKWIIRRYRIYEAAEQVARRERVDWAALAADLGYADQSHLTRDFTAAVGHPPAQYAAMSHAREP